MTEQAELEHRKELELLARAIMLAIKETLPEHTGALLLVFDYGDAGSLAYMSTVSRSDGVKLLREFMSKIEGN